MHERNVNNNIVFFFFFLGKSFCKTVKPVYNNKFFYNNNFSDTDIFRRTTVAINSSVCIVLLFSLLVVSSNVRNEVEQTGMVFHFVNFWKILFRFVKLRLFLQFLKNTNISVPVKVHLKIK